jgi:transcriptional regulator with XRE-family HTH domain
MIRSGTDMNRKAGGRPPPGDPGPRREGLGRAIQALRAERGLKRQRLAEDAGVSYAYLAEIENGKKEPSTRVLDAIARALRIRLPELMEVAESLQAMVEEKEEENLMPEQAGAYETSPVMARRLGPQDGAWFHRSIRPGSAPKAAAESEDSPPTKHAEVQSRTNMLEELHALADGLSPTDLERLLDIARRLSR